MKSRRSFNTRKPMRATHTQKYDAQINRYINTIRKLKKLQESCSKLKSTLFYSKMDKFVFVEQAMVFTDRCLHYIFLLILDQFYFILPTNKLLHTYFWVVLFYFLNWMYIAILWGSYIYKDTYEEVLFLKIVLLIFVFAVIKLRS